MNPKRILLVDDDPQSLESTRRILERSDYEVMTMTNGQDAYDKLQTTRKPIDLILTDIRMPQVSGMDLLKMVLALPKPIPVILMTAYGRIENAVEAMKLGAVDFLTKPFRRKALMDSIELALQKEALKQARPSQTKSSEPWEIVGESEVLKKCKVWIEQVARGDSTVLITGESGTGKERVARQIHAKSGRSQSPFIALNCAALPESLMESELFGHEKGAFSGALQAKKGLFEAAQNGTLLLDEIGDLPLSLQAKLLRVLQEGEIRPLGATQSKKVNVRVLSSTHRDLKALVKQGRFREDLVFRLDVINIEVPPLRDRIEDIDRLVQTILSDLKKRFHHTVEAISSEALSLLKNYVWPGNVRELVNVLERAVVLCDKTETEIQVAHLPDHIRESELAGRTLRAFQKTIEVPVGSRLKDVEDILIRKTLEATQGDKATAARLLGVNSRTIYRKLEKEKKS